MDKYLEALDNYIRLRIEYHNLDLDCASRVEEYHRLFNAKEEMQVYFKILINSINK